MAITAIRPNSVVSNNGFNDGYGSGTHDARLSDSSDSTSVWFTKAESELFALGTFTISAGTYVRRIRFVERMQVRNMHTDGQTYRFYDIISSGVTIATETYFMDPTIIFTLVRGWFNLQLTQAQLDGLRVNYGAKNSGASNPTEFDTYDIRLDVDTNSYPTATPTAPTGNVTTTTRPTVTVSYADADSDAMDRYRVKVFSAAQYGAGGFSPETSAATWDSGEVALTIAAGTSFDVTVGVDLANSTTYRAYVKVRQGVDSKWSEAWTNTQFNIALDAPAVPLLVGTLDNANGRIKLDFQGRDNFLSKNAASLETDTTGWIAGTSSTIARTTTAGTFLHGIAALSVTRDTTTGTGSATALAVALAGTQYTALASFKAATTGRSVRVNIRWLDAGFGTISTTTGTSVSDTTGGWVQATVTGTAPALTAAVAVDVEILSAVATEVHYVDQISFAPGASTTWTRGGFVGAGLYRVEIQRSVDGGTVYTPLTIGSFVPPLNTLTQTVYDYTAPVGIASRYRAVAFGTDTLEIAGPASAIAGPFTSVPTTSTGWVLKDPLDASFLLTPDIEQETWDYNIKEEQAVYSPLGRRLPVVVSDVVRGLDGPIKFGFTSIFTFALFRAMRERRHILLLQRVSVGQQWFIRLRADFKVSEYLDYYTVQCDFVEVDPPAGY